MAIPMRPKTNLERMLDAPMLAFNLDLVLKQLKSEDIWRNIHRNAMTLMKRQDMSVVLTAVQRGVDIPLHHTPGMASIQVLEGCLRVITPSQQVTVGKGEMLTLHAGIPHQMEALETSAFLLTLCG